MTDDISIDFRIKRLHIKCPGCDHVTEVWPDHAGLVKVPLTLHKPQCAHSGGLICTYDIEHGSPTTGSTTWWAQVEPASPKPATCPCGIHRNDCEYHK